jgi:hypothetical protein
MHTIRKVFNVKIMDSALIFCQVIEGQCARERSSRGHDDNSIGAFLGRAKYENRGKD